MANPTITIPVDPQTARAFDSVPEDERRKIKALLGLWLRDLATSGSPSLEEVLDDVGRKAIARGLTPEALESLLKGA
jgi:hypothetical protein